MKERTIKIIVHAMIWSAFLVLLLLFMPFYDLSLKQKPLFFLSTYGILIGYYYFNYNFLVPRFLAKRQFLKFALMTLAIIYLYISLSDAFNWMKSPGVFPGDDGFGPPGSERIEMIPPDYKPSSETGTWSHVFPEKPRFRLPVGSTLTFLLVFMVSTGTRIISSWFESERKKNQAEREKSIAELAALKSQLNPHFLFNTLNSIYYLALRKSDSTPDIVLKLSDLMRFVLTETKAEFIPLEKEIDSIRQYIDLQKLRITDKTQINFEITGEITDQKVAPLLLLPFVENAFKFGISAHSYTQISIFLSVMKEKLSFIIRNSKIRQMTPGETTGTGLKNVRQRLQLSYPGKHALKIQETESVFAVELKIILS
jgi:two-component system, LytTR family, sensor kinase